MGTLQQARDYLKSFYDALPNVDGMSLVLYKDMCLIHVVFADDYKVDFAFTDKVLELHNYPEEFEKFIFETIEKQYRIHEVGEE